MNTNSVILSDICEILNGYAFDSTLFSTSNGFPLIRIRDMKKSHCSLKFLGKYDEKYVIRKGELLIGMDGEFEIYEWQGEPSLLNQRVCKLIPKSNLLNKYYLLHRLKSNLKEIEKKTPSTTVKHLSSSQILNIKWPFLPSYSNQEVIGTLVHNQLAEIEKAREATEIQLQEVTNLANAIIFESLNKSDKTTNSLGDVLEEVKHGIGKNWRDYPVYGATRKGIALAKEPPGKQAQKYKPVIPGTVFYNPMRILIGSIAFAEVDVIDGITSPDYVVLKGKEGLIDSRWFYFWLRSPLGEQCINSLARGAVRERMLFNRLTEGQIELPDYTIQKEASEALSNLKSLSINLVQQLKEIETLPNRLLAQAFSDIDKG